MSQSVSQTWKSARTTTRPKPWCVVALVAASAIMGGPCAAQAQEDGVAVSPSLLALARARKHVQKYFERFSDLTCKESVTQLVLNGSGRTIYR